MRKSYLPYGKQYIDEADIAAVVNILRSDYLTTGPVIQQFEKKIADYVGAKYAVSFSNGTAALHGACFAAGIGEDDEVITTPITFAASANCILYQGGTVVFADVDQQTYNIDPLEIEKKITAKTKAIIPVHFTGQPANLDAIHKLAKEHNLIVIEDAAHALGATYKDEKIGALSDMTMFSFHPVKHITTGEGGIITTNSEEYYEKLMQFRSHGITRDSKLLPENPGSWYYDMQYLGYNYRMTDIQAALGCSQLNKLDVFVKRRKEIVTAYNEAFNDLIEVQMPYQHPDTDSSWHLYILKLNLETLTLSRKDVFKDLHNLNIGVNVHYIPVHTLSYYQELGYKKGSLPKAEQLYEEIISLPLFPLMTNQDIQDVINAVKFVIKRVRK
ncbi:UDP-4-amino-4,6-dideoxy-N-acetyl-beta-L-altrosamine transaminase [Lysinibacillus sp. G4S2]|uniref:UDP-4-amino-4, 6-dideoxy-N-acetyl-beta-L-altrosamine transaminase n=1 Tax=Lysinibacillus sp. G4S2 TaxID=3055859 RepID=UPI0025A2FC03|nr:UDP-4-amino-4,6-dideoxy-N-acetyl-beta-L-altrosamine transaminase [Lysinibacillus sp. G4S2]MDM5246497.1 UDP-4-amino-4,6-dideoxy-N-acetyl-beta-L-altrosamine transaminase [Lysinibacillus sp. G4S2]